MGLGNFGSVLIPYEKPKEKHWPVDQTWQFINPKYVSFLLDLWCMENQVKFYGAEWKEELDEYNIKLS